MGGRWWWVASELTASSGTEVPFIRCRAKTGWRPHSTWLVSDLMSAVVGLDSRNIFLYR